MDGEVTSDSCFIEASEPEGLEPMKKCGSDTALPGAASASGCFDCNICLDFAVDPVVTLCGHLYCWPCIYKWLDQAPLETQVQQCPVCKASLSQSALVPLYGRGNKPHHALEDIPRRPPSLHRPASEPESPRSPVPHHRLDHRPYYGYPYGDHVSPPASPMRTPTGARMFHYTSGGVLGGMAIAVLPWVLRNQEVAGGQYGGGLSPPRVRRQEMQVERSLHQIWVFFCCCALLCLLLF